MFCSQIYAEQHTIWFSSSASSKEPHFASMQEQAERRWRDFQSYRVFETFSPGKLDDILEKDFERIHSTRSSIWTTEDYTFAQHLIDNDLIRAPGCIAFAYNNTVPYYNASTMCLNNQYCIACEGPRSKDIPKFFELLTTHHVTHLVRLTDSYEGETKKCHPYWEGHLSDTSDGKRWLNIPTDNTVYSIRAFDMAHWRDNQGVDPEELLALVLQVRREVKDSNGLLLVHCSAGVGRTGTFLAALAIVDAIDRGTPFSIEEIVYKLSLQRVLSVGKFSQYITLHRLAEHYLKRKTLVFRSQVELENAFKPFSIHEITARMSRSSTPFTLHFQYKEGLDTQKVIPLRNSGVNNLLKTEVYKSKALTVCYPDKPRVPHHLSLVLNREQIGGIADITEDENAELFATIKKIAEIYKTLSIKGFVIAQYDRPQDGHLGRYVVEIIPHLPRFAGIKNIVDKVECNRHILFRSANITPAKYLIKEEEIHQQAQFWMDAFKQQQATLNESNTTITYPYTRLESHQTEAEQVLYNQLLEQLQDKGGTTLMPLSFEPIMPIEPSEHVKSINIESCSFCDKKIIDRQLVFELNDVALFYNIRRPAKESACFLLLPKRHTEKVYGLNASELKNIHILRAALVEVLKETHPGYEVIAYTQDDPSVGQTVFHSHEQIIAVDPVTIPISWTLMALYPDSHFSDEEMLKVREEYGSKLRQKLLNK